MLPLKVYHKMGNDSSHLTQYHFKKGEPHPLPKDPSAGPANNAQRLQRFFAKIIESEAYQASYTARALAGKLSAAVEVAMFQYYGGKPKETVDITHRNVADALVGLPPEQVLSRHHALAHRMNELNTSLVASAAQVEQEKKDALGVAWASDATMPKRPM